MFKYFSLCKRYGLTPRIFGKSKELTVREKQILECRVNIINMCDQMITALEYIKNQVKESPEDGSDDYVNAISSFRDRVKEVNKKMEENLVVG